MATFKAVGLVLRDEAAGESNKRLTILTEQRGKIAAFARGARGAKSKLAVAKLAYCEFIFYDGGQFLSLTQIAPLRHFAAIPADYDAYCGASFILELADKMLLADMETRDALRLILLALARLDKGDCPKLVLAAFILKFLQGEGYRPRLDGDYFGNEGLASEGRKVHNPTKDALSYIVGAEMTKVFNFKTSQDVAEELLACALVFLRANVDVEISSMTFIEGD